MYVRGMRALFEFTSYVVDRIAVDGEATQVKLKRDGRYGLRCLRCGARATENRRVPQTAYDLPLGISGWVILVYDAIQVRCASCRCYSTLRPLELDERARSTVRLMRFVSALCRYMPVSHVAEFVPISAATAHRWDKAVLMRELPEPQLDDLRVLLIDEKAIRKRHGYVTLVMNGETGELLHMAEGKKKASLQAFLDKLNPEQKDGIVAVCIDRAGAYYEQVKEQLPDADIVFDKFHLIRNYLDVIDEVRRQEWRGAKRQDRQIIKGQRYALFANVSKLTPDRKRTLKELLRVNKNLSKVYILKDAFKKLWTYTYRAWAERYLHQWTTWAKEAGLAPLTKFADAVLKAKDEILNYCHHHITTAKLEAFNNTVSRIIHRACGVQDLDYLFLKLRQEALATGLQT